MRGQARACLFHISKKIAITTKFIDTPYLNGYNYNNMNMEPRSSRRKNPFREAMSW